jgi:hypothetical protein
LFDLFAETRARFGAPPRSVASVSRASNVTFPAWLKSASRLYEAESARSRVFQHGRVVRSWLVMANELLFKPGPSPHPGLVLYAPGDDVDLETLSEVAGEVFGLRGSKPADAELAAFVPELGDRAAPMAKPVPRALARGRALCMTAVLFRREHLPRAFLGANFLPLVLDDASSLAVVLPGWMWGEDLRAGWVDASVPEGGE